MRLWIGQGYDPISEFLDKMVKDLSEIFLSC